MTFPTEQKVTLEPLLRWYISLHESPFRYECS